ncbi:mannitol dehydrogenase family protein [Azospirillum rugosum]|nr:mannitol dehydrogenase family protein [Azospirillum rugosum]
MSLATLGHLPRTVRRPAFDVAALRPGILHLGCGAFHRAHQAVFTQHAIEAEGPGAPAPWGILGVSLVRPVVRDALRPQDWLYTVLQRGSNDDLRAEVVGSLRGVLYGPDHPAALAARFLDPAIRIVTLTVTASAYCLDPGTGRLRADHPDIGRDLRAAAPRSALGVLVAGLDLVRKAGRRPPVVMSCDNLTANGRTLRQAVLDYAALRDDGLAQWIGRSVQFPSSMVDRIVPATTDTDAFDAAATLGLADAAPVSTEPFRQWVVEAFDGPRPRWEAAGAEFVPDVAPWESSKLRLLNGTHLALACLGLLAGFETVAEVAEDPVFAGYALRLMLDEQKPTLPPSGHDIDSYARQLLLRWRNPGIAHSLSRIGRDGSGKIHGRLLAPALENLRAGRPVPCATLAVAAWIACLSGRVPVALQDPVKERITALNRAAGGDVDRFTAAVLERSDIFGDALPRLAPFRKGVRDGLSLLDREGPRNAARALLAADMGWMR